MPTQHRPVRSEQHRGVMQPAVLLVDEPGDDVHAVSGCQIRDECFDAWSSQNVGREVPRFGAQPVARIAAFGQHEQLYAEPAGLLDRLGDIRQCLLRMVKRPGRRAGPRRR